MMSRLSELTGQLSGHAWTVGPKVWNTLTRPAPPESHFWSRETDRWQGQPVRVTGQYRRRDCDTLVVIVHGLGGCADSDYVVRAAIALEEAGLATLRLSLRGADRTGDDMYHGGLWHDVAGAVTDPLFEDYDRIFVIGFSLGGHIALRTAIELDAPRLQGVAAICSPLDLGAAQAEIDEPKRRMYREYILWELRHLYREVAERRPVPTPLKRVQMVRTLREWDALTVVPRFGFRDVDDYYETVSVAGDLEGLRRPALLVATEYDPLVLPSAVEAGLPVETDRFEVKWVRRGGHVFLPRNIDLGYAGRVGVIPQALTWLEQNSEP